MLFTFILKYKEKNAKISKLLSDYAHNAVGFLSKQALKLYRLTG